VRSILEIHRNSTVGKIQKTSSRHPFYIQLFVSESESKLSLSLSLSLQRSNGQRQRRTTTEHNEIIDHGVEAHAPTSANRRNTHPQAPPEAVAERRGTHQYPHSPEGDSNRFDAQRDHHTLHLLLPLPLHYPHAPLQLFTIITISFL